MREAADVLDIPPGLYEIVALVAVGLNILTGEVREQQFGIGIPQLFKGLCIHPELHIDNLLLPENVELIGGLKRRSIIDGYIFSSALWTITVMSLLGAFFWAHSWAL